MINYYFFFKKKNNHDKSYRLFNLNRLVMGVEDEDEDEDEDDDEYDDEYEDEDEDNSLNFLRKKE